MNTRPYFNGAHHIDPLRPRKHDSGEMAPQACKISRLDLKYTAIARYAPTASQVWKAFEILLLAVVTVRSRRRLASTEDVRIHGGVAVAVDYGETEAGCWPLARRAEYEDPCTRRC